jgi:hypothetical protein
MARIPIKIIKKHQVEGWSKMDLLDLYHYLKADLSELWIPYRNKNYSEAKLGNVIKKENIIQKNIEFVMDQYARKLVQEKNERVA